MTFTEKIVPETISNLIEQQFPSWFIEHGPVFTEFVKQYYAWMEQPENALWASRNYYNIKDIDYTFDQFIIYFKEKYLKNIQLQTQTNTRMLVKHALDIYRSKGTERGVQLLFQLVFDEVVRFYYPSTDLFKLSDGEWYRPRYLELQLSDNNIFLVNKEIYGYLSGAVAYVDSVVRRMTKGRLQDIAYISAITGNFTFGEKIIPNDGSLTITQCSCLTGSLTGVEISVLGSGQNFSNGDIVTLTSNFGEGAEGIVTETIDQFGIVDAQMIEGGYGYTTANNTTYISNVSFIVSNLQISNSGVLQYFQQFDTLTQTQVWLNYNSANGGFNPGDMLTTYFANGVIKGTGVVFMVSQTNSSAGSILAELLTGNLQAQFYTAANAITANVNASNGYVFANATGLFMANDNYLTLSYANAIGAFRVGEEIYQPSARGWINAVSSNSITVVANVGIFHPEFTVTGLFSGAVANVTNIAVGIGLSNTTGTFYAIANNTVTGPSITGTISRIDLGSGFGVEFSNTLIDTETVALNTDLLASYSATNINAASYGFPANTSANLSSVTISNALSFTNTLIGKPISMIVSSLGTGYTKPPFIVLDYPIRALCYHEYDLTLANTTGSFSPGEIVTQSATSARGLVLNQVGNTGLIVQNMRFYQNNKFVVTTNSTTIMTGQFGSTANIVSVDFDDSPNVMGHNVQVATNFVVGNGAILTLQVTDSGFGFIPDEIVTMGNANGIPQIMKQGTGQGYYRQKGGFLSDQKKLYDNYFYQNYSYQIISPIMMDKYQKMLNDLMHIAGTIMFGKFVYSNDIDLDVTINNAQIKIA